MAFEPGGRADKLGNRYESRWVVKQLLALLREEIHSVTIEAIGDDEKGVDLWIGKKDGSREAQQCKARNSSEESWSIADLKHRGILDYIRKQLDRNPDVVVTLVTGVPAQLLSDICYSARNSNDNPDDFYKYQILGIGEARRELFHKFCQYLGLDVNESNGRTEAYDYLRRTCIELFPDAENVKNDLLTQIGSHLTGKPETVFATMADYPISHDCLGKPIYVDNLRNYLKLHDINPKNLAYDERINPAIERLQEEFKNSINPSLIKHSLIPREETKKCFEATKDKNCIVILHGGAGSGKSSVLFELSQKLQDENVPFLPVRLDRRVPNHTAVHFGKDIGFPDSPVLCLAAIAGLRPCVLILDQLDAVRWTSSHSSDTLEVCKELINQAISFGKAGKHLSVVLSCRTFDLENDPEIKNWLNDQNKKNSLKIQVQPLPNATVRSIVGFTYDMMSRRQQEILANPQNLSMWDELTQSEILKNFQSNTGLMKKFWNFKKQQLAEFGIPATEINSLLDKLVNYMDNKGLISAPERILSNCSVKAVNEFKSQGIIQDQNSIISFCHQSYLDFCVAERILSQIDEGGDILKWLGSKEKQSLFRREQLRQALTLLHDESFDVFFREIKNILKSTGVRFYLKHLVLEFISQIEDIPSVLADYCIDLLKDNYWAHHFLETVFSGHVSFVKILIDRELISTWLNSNNDSNINQALRILESTNTQIPNEVTDCLVPFLHKEEQWNKRILNTICRDILFDSESMFEVRLQLAKVGLTRDFFDWKSLSSKYPIRALRMMEGILSKWLITEEDTQSPKQNSRSDGWYDNDWSKISKIAENYPEETWNMLMPHIKRLLLAETSSSGDRFRLGLKHGFNNHYSARSNILEGAVELSILAGNKMAQINPGLLCKWTQPLESHDSALINEMLFGIYTNLTVDFANIGIKWILADINRIESGAGVNESKWMPAVLLIKALSPHCSEDLFKKLEDSIVAYHSKNEKQTAGRILAIRKQGDYPHYWGMAQYFLLPALPANRIKKETYDLITVLKHTFDKVPKENFNNVSSTGVFHIGSKLDSNLTRISDNAWLKIITNKKIKEECAGTDFRVVDKDEAVQSSVFQFSRSLRKIAEWFPDRFGQLALRFPIDTHPNYISAILEAIRLTNPNPDVPDNVKSVWRPASIKTVLDIVNRFSDFNDCDVASSFCHLMEDRASEEWPDYAIKNIIFLATRHPDPLPGRLNVYDDVDKASIEVLFQYSINCIRGKAAVAIGNLLWNHSIWLDKFKPCIESLITDPHPVVRMAAINTIMPVLNINQEQAVNWFCELSKMDLRVPASHYAQKFFNHTIQEYHEQLKPIADGMVNSEIAEVSQAGAELITAYSIFYDLFHEDVELYRVGTVPQRKGVAKTAAAFIQKNEYAAQCRELIIPFLDDPESEVRNATFFRFQDNYFSSNENVLFTKTLILSQAFAENGFHLIQRLGEHTGSLLLCSSLIFDFCHIITSSLLEESRSLNSAISTDIHDMPALLLRLYERAQKESPEIADQCLDIWDILFENRVGVTRSLLKAIEN